MVEYRISRKELSANHHYYKNDQWLLVALQLKGAPVTGSVYLKADLENHSWIRHEDPLTGDIIFHVEAKK